MKPHNVLIVIFLTLFFLACGTKNNTSKNDFVLKTNAEKGVISKDKNLSLSIENKKNHPIDSIIYQLDGHTVASGVALSELKLGKHLLAASVFFNNTKTIVKHHITILNDQAPQIFTYKIINTYPHDIDSYTQGLEFYKGRLYESTGQYKHSKLREVVYKTGQVIKNINLGDDFFGEGITVLNDQIYQLTWRKKMGFVYNVATFKEIKRFKYNRSKEGWGLCNDGQTIYKSDGSEKIWKLNPQTLTEEGFIQVYTNRGKIIEINEMEWINGQIYANRYQKDGVAIINPENGAVVGVIDFSSLKKKVTQHKDLDVLNGIAYNPTRKTIFVTGKHWDKLFEIVVEKK